MANLTSWNDAKKRIETLQKSITEQQRQLKEIESHIAEFVDNPQNPINEKKTIGPTEILYIPTLSDRKHYPMKKEDLDRHFDDIHMPIYFTDEHSCFLFDSIITVLMDMLKFKAMYDDNGNIKPTRVQPLYTIYLNTETNMFVSTESCIFSMYNTVYFSSQELADNCAIWLNYKYELGPYAK